MRGELVTKSTQSLIEQLHAEAEEAARAGDHQTHTALHVVEMKLREARLSLLDAEKIVKGEALELITALLGGI